MNLYAIVRRIGNPCEFVDELGNKMIFGADSCEGNFALIDSSWSIRSVIDEIELLSNVEPDGTRIKPVRDSEKARRVTLHTLRPGAFIAKCSIPDDVGCNCLEVNDTTCEITCSCVTVDDVRVIEYTKSDSYCEGIDEFFDRMPSVNDSLSFVPVSTLCSQKNMISIEDAVSNAVSVSGADMTKKYARYVMNTIDYSKREDLCEIVVGCTNTNEIFRKILYGGNRLLEAKEMHNEFDVEEMIVRFAFAMNTDEFMRRKGNSMSSNIQTIKRCAKKFCDEHEFTSFIVPLENYIYWHACEYMKERGESDVAESIERKARIDGYLTYFSDAVQ